MLHYNVAIIVLHIVLHCCWFVAIQSL